MATVSNVEELKQALASDQGEIVIVDKALAKQVNTVKGLSGAALASIVVSGGFFVVNPLVGAATLAALAVWLGRDVVALLFALGKELTRKLYFMYSVTNKDKTKFTLQKK
jgi:hypothetical protein